MDFELTEEQRSIRSRIRELCEEFGDEYWQERDANHEYPSEFFGVRRRRLVRAHHPEAFGGQG
jgi:acyl-CoA dehydrogenase